MNDIIATAVRTEIVVEIDSVSSTPAKMGIHFTGVKSICPSDKTKEVTSINIRYSPKKKGEETNLYLLSLPIVYCVIRSNPISPL